VAKEKSTKENSQATSSRGGADRAAKLQKQFTHFTSAPHNERAGAIFTHFDTFLQNLSFY
jgi:hypothetical protein